MKGTDSIVHAFPDLNAKFEQVRAFTERLAAPLSPEDQTVQSMPDVSPTKWHLAHTSWFFETFVLRPHLQGYQTFRPHYEVLFNSYYNSVGAPFPRPARGLLTRPGVEEVLEYRRHVDTKMRALLQAPSDEVLSLTVLGLNHEQQHQELLLTDIKHVLFQNPIHPTYLSTPARPHLQEAPSPLSFIRYEGGVAEIGHTGDSGEFSFDNEGPRHRVLLGDFELASRPINNQDVLTFIEAGGYDDPLLWLSDGWAFKNQHSLRHPYYWVEGPDGTFSQFTHHGMTSLDLAETACHLTYFEADAIARFFGARLPTEQEWECAASRQDHVIPPLDPTSVRPGIAAPKAPGKLSQMMGGVWEWTQSPYVAYPGYSPPQGAVGEYNGKFMHNQIVLRGGSCATPTNHARITYRNFFPSSAQWQFSGARLAKGDHRP